MILATLLFATASTILPPWFPSNMFTINPDNMTVEDFGSDTFKVGNPSNPQEIEVKGHHWAGSLYPPQPESSWDKWKGTAVFLKVRQQLEAQGFKIVFLDADESGAHGTFRKDATYVDLRLTNDAYSNNVSIVEPAANARTLTLRPPAAQPESFSDAQDFPYVTPLTGAKLLDTRRENGPMNVAPSDKEPQLVGSGTLSKLYEGPPKVSALDFNNTYEAAFKNAGWTIAENTGGTVTAHFTKNGRDVWARVYQEGADRWNVVVADVGSALKLALDKNCKVALYGINFDFNKATIRPDSEPVLNQVAAVLKSQAVSVEIGGHTDNVGAPAYNAKLSQDRADAVKIWLVAHGIAANRLTTRGYGDTVPVVPNNSDPNRARNRRVELKKGGCP